MTSECLRNTQLGAQRRRFAYYNNVLSVSGIVKQSLQAQEGTLQNSKQNFY